MTTPLAQIRALVDRLAPHPICDRCLAERLCTLTPQRANLEVRQLVGANGFERRRDICSLCYAERLVTRRATSLNR